MWLDGVLLDDTTSDPMPFRTFLKALVPSVGHFLAWWDGDFNFLFVKTFCDLESLDSLDGTLFAFLGVGFFSTILF